MNQHDVSRPAHLPLWTPGAVVARAFLFGLAGTCAFPLVIESLGSEPILDSMPRELFILLCAGGLFRTVDQQSAGPQRAWICFGAGLVHFSTLFYWLDTAMVTFGGLSRALAIPIVLLLASYCAIYWAVLPRIFDLLKDRARVPAPFAFACAIIVLEWLRSNLLTGFPWGLWGYSQTRNLPLLQLASITGIYGLGGLVALTGAILSNYVRRPGTDQTGRWGLALVVLLGSCAAFGYWRLSIPVAEDDAVTLRAGIAQGNIEQRIKNRSRQYKTGILDVYTTLSREASTKVDFVIWPEAAWPEHIRTTTERVPVQTAGTPHLIGASMYDAGPTPRASNSAIWLTPEGHIDDRYDKQHLVPFGEYVPLRFILPVEKFVPGMIDYSAGVSSAPVGPHQIGVLICFDGVFPEIARAEVLSGARALANLTNDGWYGVSSAPYQHRDFYVVRAVENDRWVLRAANTGVSLAIDPRGRFSPVMGLQQRGLLNVTVGLRDTTTIYGLLGDWVVWVSLILLGLGAIRRLSRWLTWPVTERS